MLPQTSPDCRLKMMAAELDFSKYSSNGAAETRVKRAIEATVTRIVMSITGRRAGAKRREPLSQVYISFRPVRRAFYRIGRMFIALPLRYVEV